ncbi:MAG: toprim domain-containing protein [Candidatus Hodarchaeales archaeon]
MLVEGKRDIEALETIGIKLTNGKILARKGLSLINVVDKIHDTSVIILLLDFDKEGKHIRGKILKELQTRKGHGFIDPFPRQLMYKFFRAARINEIEEVKRYSSVSLTLEDKFNNNSPSSKN